MKNRWLAASNFERMHEIISAINTISINAKLSLTGIQEPVAKSELAKAQELLSDFLSQFYAQLQTTEQNTDGTVVGNDPRLGELLESYLVEKKRSPNASGLYAISPGKLLNLVKTTTMDDFPQLIECLRDLRTLLEQHSQADINNMLGDI
jgi:hypothetical protein